MTADEPKEHRLNKFKKRYSLKESVRLILKKKNTFDKR